MTEKGLFPDGCTAPELGQLVEDYLSGELPPERMTAFEEHFFKCSACLEAIRIRQSGPQAIAQASRGAPRRLRIGLGLLVIAVAIAVGSLVVCRSRPGARNGRESSTTLIELARVAAPAYLPAIAGGDSPRTQRSFDDAMRRYASGDFVRAVVGLESAWKSDPSCSETGFYLGASYLLTNRVDRAIAALSSTVALGDTPFRDRSKFLLAKAHLRREAMEDARRELREIIAGGGDLQGEAERLLAAVDRVSSGLH